MPRPQMVNRRSIEGSPAEATLAPAGSRGKRWERRSDARPSELIAAALRLFAERGFAATRLEDVAASAGVSKGTVYLYFESKERLFEAVVRETVTPKLDRASLLVESFEGSTADLLGALFTVMAGVLGGPLPSVVKLIVAESGNFPELARLWSELAVSRVFALMRKVVERGIARGEFRAVDPELTAPLILAPVLVLALWKQTLAPHTDVVLEPQKLLAAHLEMVLAGLATTEPKRDPGTLPARAKGV